MNIVPSLEQLDIQSVLHPFTALGKHEATGRRIMVDGRIRLRLLAKYLDELSTLTPGSALFEAAGQVETPHWRGAASLSHSAEDFGIDLNLDYTGKSKLDNRYVSIEDIDNNRVKLQLVTSVGGHISIAPDRRFEVFAGINNLFNVDPPLSPAIHSSIPKVVNAGAPFDCIGRYLFAGFRTNFK